MDKPKYAVVVPCGPGVNSILDTLDSIHFFCPEKHEIVIIDDHTTDGTYEAVKRNRKINWHILRNERKHGVVRLARTLGKAFKYVLSNVEGDIVLRIDQDALLVGHGVLSNAGKFAESDPITGIFGVYEIDYNRTRSYEYHRKLINRELRWIRRWFHLTPWWEKILLIAESKGYRRGENVFGGAYFITRKCLQKINDLGGLDIPYNWKSILQEDVYFSMAAVASGFKLRHFAFPQAPICLEWRGLPYPAREIIRLGVKITHSVDKGRNTGREENEGVTAREYFRMQRIKK